MFDLSEILIIFVFGLVVTGVVYLGVLQAREDAKKRIGADIDPS